MCSRYVKEGQWTPKEFNELLEEFLEHKLIADHEVTSELKKIHPGGGFINLDRGKWSVEMTKAFATMQCEHGLMQKT